VTQWPEGWSKSGARSNEQADEEPTWRSGGVDEPTQPMPKVPPPWQTPATNPLHDDATQVLPGRGAYAGGAENSAERPAERTAILPPELSPRAAERPRLDPSHGFRPPPGPPAAPWDQPPGGPPAGPHRPQRRPRRRRRLRLGRILSVLLVLLLTYVVALAFFVAGSLNKIDAFAGLGNRPADSRGSTWLIVGSDSRAGLTAEERRKLRTGSTQGRRTDTIMLLHVPSGGKPTLVSLPRDSYVKIPGRSNGKLNAAYAVGGPSLLIGAVEGATGLRIDHYMEIGFGGIVDITDAVGGVDVCVPRDMVDRRAGLNVRKGCRELDGATSLGYVRARYSDPKGDLGRIERQQQWLSALSKKISSPSVYLNPIAQVRLSRSGTDAVTVDEGTGLLGVVSAARAMRGVSSGGGTVATVPVADPDYRRGGESFVRWDEKASAAFFKALRAGDPVPKAAAPTGRR